MCCKPTHSYMTPLIPFSTTHKTPEHAAIQHYLWTCTAYCIWSVIHSHTSYSLFVCIVQPIAFGVSFNLNRHQPIRQYTHTHASFLTHAYCVYCTVYCIWSVIQSQSPISISSVSFQQNVANETSRTR